MQDAENAVNPSYAARLNRLLSILQRLKWEQGEDGLVRPVSPAEALNDLGLYMLGHEIDMAVERQQSEAAPVVPEGFALVPAEITKAMKEAVRENGGGQAMIYALAAWGDLLSAAPAAPLRTEAQVRAEARREALDEVQDELISFAESQSGEVFLGVHSSINIIRALVEQQTQ